MFSKKGYLNRLCADTGQRNAYPGLNTSASSNMCAANPCEHVDVRGEGAGYDDPGVVPACALEGEHPCYDCDGCGVDEVFEEHVCLFRFFGWVLNMSMNGVLKAGGYTGVGEARRSVENCNSGSINLIQQQILPHLLLL